jgi:hypothetical protein
VPNLVVGEENTQAAQSRSPFFYAKIGIVAKQEVYWPKILDAFLVMPHSEQ